MTGVAFAMDFSTDINSVWNAVSETRGDLEAYKNLTHCQYFVATINKEPTDRFTLTDQRAPKDKCRDAINGLEERFAIQFIRGLAKRYGLCPETNCLSTLTFGFSAFLGSLSGLGWIISLFRGSYSVASFLGFAPRLGH
jgi:hypothetical protein